MTRCRHILDYLDDVDEGIELAKAGIAAELDRLGYPPRFAGSAAPSAIAREWSP